MPDARITIEECGKIFILVNFEEEKQTVQSEVNEDKALMRFELLEVFVRIAVAKFLGTKRHRKPPSTCTTVARLQLIAKRFGSCAWTATSARAAAGRDGGDGAGGSIDVDDADDAAAEAEAAEAKAKAEIAEKEEEEDLGLIDDVSECLELLFAHIERWLPPETTTDEDIFRRGRLYCEEVPGKRKMIYRDLYAEHRDDRIHQSTEHLRPLRMPHEPVSQISQHIILLLSDDAFGPWASTEHVLLLHGCSIFVVVFVVVVSCKIQFV